MVREPNNPNPREGRIVLGISGWRVEKPLEMVLERPSLGLLLEGLEFDAFRSLN